MFLSFFLRYPPQYADVKSAVSYLIRRKDNGYLLHLHSNKGR